ncbi:MAG: hypothetical protein JO250_02415 [Armatimonadetes bacterium]|nr:hypothetical protein [Armatimonadota bacterium]
MQSAMRPHSPLPRSAAAAALGLMFGLTAAAPAAPRPARTSGSHAARPRFVTRVPTAADLYNRSLDADDHFSYRGRQVTTYWLSGRAVAVIVSHLAVNLRRLDYIAPERLQGRKSISNSRERWEYDPRRRLLYHYRLAPDADAVADAATAYALLKTNYLVAVAPQKQTYDNRKVFLLAIKRRRSGTLARRLWIDAATGLVLKRESYREAYEDRKLAAKLAVTVAYADINFRPRLTRAEFDPARLARRPGVRVVEQKRDPEGPIPVASVPRQLGGAWLTPASLAGYRLVGAALTSGRRPLLHLRYSDGLNLVSLFEQRRTQTRQPTRVPGTMRPLRVGSASGHVVSHASLTAINWDTAAFNLTLMGEIAQKTLQQLAAAVGDRRP